MEERGFKTKLGVLTATLGSAVGLGNIWKFPALTGENGGAGFIFVYLLASFILGLPLMMTEISLGRKVQGGVIKVFSAPQKAWKLVSFLALSSVVLLIAFYSDVAGWVITYFVQSITGTLPDAGNTTLANANFSSVITTPTIALGGQYAMLTIVGIILFFGVNKGIERITKILLPILTILLIILAVRGLTLDGAMKGLSFLFYPDFSKITGQTILMAVGLAFFKLSLGSGTMMTYGSYFPSTQNIPLTCLRVMFSDLAISLIAGIAIFPAVFTFNLEPTDGPSLLFVVIPAVFNDLPYGSIFISAFFLLSIFAAIGATLSIMEVIIVVFMDLGFSRTKSLLITLSICVLFGTLATLSLTPILSNFLIFDKDFFRLFDFLSSNIFMLVTGLCTVLYAGWYMNKKELLDQISNNNTISIEWLLHGWLIIIRYIVPVLIIITLINGLL